MLDGHVALVTGGGTNLGKAAAAELAACGADVVICGRRSDVLEATAAEIGPSCSWAAGDVRDADECSRMVEETVARHGRLDTLVSNAGGQYFTPAEGIASKGWRAVMRLNVGGTLLMAEAAASAMRRNGGGGAGRGGGTIINTTLSPHHGLVGMTHSSAARAAVEALTRELADEWAGDNVHVCAVAPGPFDTTSLRKYPEPVYRAAATSVPLQRLGRMEEHAWLVALLASPLGEAFNGAVVTLDGARDNWYGAWPPVAMSGDSGEVPTEERRSTPVT
ncbi:MAG: short-chain dehydrogenase [Solirubrobacterales bacterium]|nr:MAG: short-chain dehydrogenase [Solirubrobacterales bacterium]